MSMAFDVLILLLGFYILNMQKFTHNINKNVHDIVVYNTKNLETTNPSIIDGVFK